MIDIPATTEEIDALVTKVAARYKKRSWWAPFDDMKQAGWIAALECVRTWEAQVGIPYLSYVERACALKMRELLLRDSAPVSAGRGRGRLGELKGLYRATPTATRESEERNACAIPQPDDVLDDLDWCMRVRIERLELRKGVDRTNMQMAECVLYQECPPEVVATAFQVEPRRVYAATTQMRRAIRHSEKMFDLAEERR